MKVEGLLFFVSGGASGLGKAVVSELIKNNAFVSIIDLNEKLSLEAVKVFGGDKCYFSGPTDVSNENQVNEAVSKTVIAFPNIKVGGAILCGGIVAPPKNTIGYGPSQKLTSYSQFESIIKVNLLGTYCVAQKVSELLLANDSFSEDGEKGIIITVSSILGLDGTLVSYGTSKAGVAGLTLPLSKELAPFGIRVMSIAPGVFDTPIIKRPGSDSPLNLFPNRYGQPVEFAEFVLQIIKTSMLNGSVIRLDGALRG